MAKEGGKFIPLSEATGNEVVAGKKRQTSIVFDAGVMPNYTNPDGTTLQENLGINFKALRRRALMSDISELRIIGVSGKTSRFVPSIVGSSEDRPGQERTAVAGKTGVLDKASTFEIEKDGSAHVIKLNLSEISQRVSDKGQIRSAEGWAREMNSAIETALLKYQLKAILNRGNLQLIAYDAAVGALFASNKGFLGFLQGYASASAIMNVGIVLSALAEYKVFISPFKFERTVASAFISQKDKLFGTQSLVQALPQKNQN